MKLIGRLNWYRPFVKNLSGKIADITDKLKGSAEFKWTEEDGKVLYDIYEEIKKQTLLNFPDYTKAFTLYTDASLKGIGGILTQEDKLVGIFSYKFKPNELNYNTIEKEFLGIYLSLNHFKNIIFNSLTHVYTDNKNLTYNPDNSSKRVQNWKNLLNDFDYELHHIKGCDNLAADEISRVYLIDENQGYNYPYEEIQKWQQSEVTQFSKTKQIFEHFLKFDEKDRLIIPTKYGVKFVRKVHEDLGHPGGRSLIGILKSYICLPGLSKICYHVSKSCILCQQNKPFNPRKGKLTGGIYSEKPFSIISSDIVGPYESQNFINDLDNNKFWILTVTDICTRYSCAILLRRPDAENVSLLLEKHWFKRFGCPKTIISDQGKQYTSNQYKAMLKKHGISPCYTSTYNPTCNGVSERINSSISSVLRICRGGSLSAAIELINIRLNCSFHRILNATPFELKNEYSYMDPIRRKCNKLTDAKKRTLKNISEEEKKRNDIRDIQYSYKLHDKVYVQAATKGKMDKRFDGPFEVLGVMDNRLYVKAGNKSEWVNLKRLKPYVAEEGEDVVPTGLRPTNPRILPEWAESKRG
ncbi:Transposon Tf2-6 polyprotein [Thelohanellus kitauei]|uniref:Transposon Tf2-6 polyprotein n=2 Tax=Thelohanellus kitauei TaxID=669202 RepID=A0A0C2N8J7_THEKT|nr:Transposon Tf2-6 polyprotein [Thelohanellus kitauei]